MNHIEGHVSANYIAHPSLEPPFVCLVASGGHSHIVRVDDYGSYTLLGQTTDDAAGEAFDKAARVIGIPYPGGPLLDKLAEQGDEHAYNLPKAHVKGCLLYTSICCLRPTPWCAKARCAPLASAPSPCR